MKWIELAAGKEMSTRELRKAIIEEDVKNGKIPPEDPSDEMVKAKKALESLMLVLSKGGDAAAWLSSELEKLGHRLIGSGCV
jgi:hypothetical protein